MTIPAVSLAAYRAARAATLRRASLCLLRREGAVLLALKKRGFGAGKWTGVGGKPEPGEMIEATAARETREEIGVVPLDLRRVATLNFYFPHRPTWEQQVCVYVAEAWAGEPVETEEMAPRWFPLGALPFEVMWPDARHWLPPLLRGATFTAAFLYDERGRVAEWAIVNGVLEDVEEEARWDG